MTQAQRIIGKNYYVDFNGTELTADYRQFSVDRGVGSVNMAAGADAAEYAKPTLKKYGASGKFLYRGTEGTAVWADCYEGQEGTLTWGPEGTAAGKPKGQLLVMVSQLNESAGYDSEIEWDVAWEGQGGLVNDPLSDVWA